MKPDAAGFFFTEFLPSYRVSIPIPIVFSYQFLIETHLAGFYWVLLGFTGFYWVLLGFIRFFLVLPSCYLVLPSCYLVLPNFTKFYLVLPSIT